MGFLEGIGFAKDGRAAEEEDALVSGRLRVTERIAAKPMGVDVQLGVLGKGTLLQKRVVLIEHPLGDVGRRSQIDFQRDQGDQCDEAIENQLPQRGEHKDPPAR